MRNIIIQFIRLGLVILALGMVLYWVELKWFAPSRIVCDQEQLDAEGKSHICWHTLMQKYSKDKIVWIGARPANIIKNGLTKAYTLRPGREQELQYENVQPYIEQAAEDEKRCVVIFCSASCNASDQIYRYLTEEKGEDADIYVLEGGWDTIKAEAPELLKFN